MDSTISVESIFAGIPVPPGVVLPQALEVAPGGMCKVIFPDGFFCYAPTTSVVEAALIYNEIMVGQEYFRHGLTLDGARCILDVGGNIGLFTLAAKLRAPQAAVYTFEPIPETFAVLERNVQSHALPDVHLFNLAVGNQDHGRLTFTFFPNMPGNSTQAPEIKEDQRPTMDQIFGKELTAALYEVLPREAEVRTLSSLIREHGITAIDYLKIDVEGAELAVLDGIDEADWPLIRQVAIETHTNALRQQVINCLEAYGFKVERDEGLSSPVGVSDVYARRP